MKYFITEAARGASGSTAYFEFQKGRYGGECWKKDSLCISAGRWDALSLTELLWRDDCLPRAVGAGAPTCPGCAGMGAGDGRA